MAVVGAIENKLVDAGAMAQGLRDQSHIALRDLFRHRQGGDQAGERATLDEIAKLLRAQPQINVVIVGHTDSQGGCEHNMDLSRRRAEWFRPSWCDHTVSPVPGCAPPASDFWRRSAPMAPRTAARAIGAWSSLPQVRNAERGPCRDSPWVHAIRSLLQRCFAPIAHPLSS